jgi:hypothetical protein
LIFKSDEIYLRELNLAGTGIDNFILDNHLRLDLMYEIELLNSSYNKMETINSSYFQDMICYLDLSFNEI